MDLNRIDLLKEYINGNYAPILTEDKYVSILPEHGNIDVNNIENEVNVTIDGNGNQVIPKWIEEVNKTKILLIRNIDFVSKEKQRYLVEVLKSKKISNIELDKNVIIILTCQNMDLTKIDEEVISLSIQTI